MTRRPEAGEDLDDVEDLDEADATEVEEDGPIPIACRWGMPGWCATGRHPRCYFTTDPETFKTGTYGHRDGHVWICPCPCHANQGYQPCPHPDHQDHPGADVTGPARPIQINLF
jgi:hypothetical protein